MSLKAIPNAIRVLNFDAAWRHVREEILLGALNLQEDDFVLVGSGMRASVSKVVNDIDVAVLEDAIRFQDLFNSPILDHKHMPGIEVIAVEYRQPLSPATGQLDLMLSKSLPYTAWLHHSPLETSHIGADRHCLLRATVAAVSRIDIDPYSWSELSLHPLNGMERVVRTLLGKRGNPISRPTATSRTFVTFEPAKICADVLGCSMDETLSFEGLERLVNGFEERVASIVWEDYRKRRGDGQ